MTPINYIYGDATQPQGPGPKLIAHICNDAGGWGAGFVMALTARDRVPESAYRLWSQGRPGPFIPNEPFVLGRIQVVPMSPVGPTIETYVVNMIAQHGYGEDGQPPVRYSALRKCLAELRRITALFCEGNPASVHMPRIGCGLAGGNWSIVQRIIQAELSAFDVPVTVYDLDQKSRSVFVHQYPDFDKVG